MWKLLFFLISATSVKMASGQSAIDVTQVHNHIYNVISPYARPSTNLSLPTTVYVSFYLMSINEFNTAAQKLTSTAWLMVTWHDDYLTWDPKSFGGVERIFADPAQVWRPRLAIRNTMMDIRQLGNDYVVLQVDHHGRVTWYPAERFETYCQVIVTYFPLDTQTCTWDIDSWDADGVDLQAIKLDIDHSFYGNNGAWELVSSNVSKGNSKLVFQVTLKRRPGLLILNLILPVMLLGVVNIFVFTVPPESGLFVYINKYLQGLTSVEQPATSRDQSLASCKVVGCQVPTSVVTI